MSILVKSSFKQRFACECGSKFDEGGLAVLHTFQGHEVVSEELRNGRWRYDATPIATLIVQRLVERGESPAEFVTRIERRIEELDNIVAQGLEDGDPNGRV